MKHLLWIGLALLALGTVNRGIDAWTVREQAYFTIEQERLQIEKQEFELYRKGV